MTGTDLPDQSVKTQIVLFLCLLGLAYALFKLGIPIILTAGADSSISTVLFVL